MTALISFPQILGHEVVGTIERVGPAVTDRRPGERVVLNPWLSCQARGIAAALCRLRGGQFFPLLQLPERIPPEGSVQGGFIRGLRAWPPAALPPLCPPTSRCAFPIPDDVSDEQAVLADPFCVSLHAILNFPPGPRDTVVVCGCGTLGLLAVAILRLLYPETRVIAIYKYAQQKVLAERFGATETVSWRPSRDIIPRIASLLDAEILAPMYGKPMLNGGVPIIYDMVGSAESMEVGLRICDSRGKIVIIGVATPKRFEWTPLYFKEVSLIGSNGFGFEDFGGRAKARHRDLFRSDQGSRPRYYADSDSSIPAGTLRRRLPCRLGPGQEQGGKGGVRISGVRSANMRVLCLRTFWGEC